MLRALYFPTQRNLVIRPARLGSLKSLEVEFIGIPNLYVKFDGTIPLQKKLHILYLTSLG
jgi:hypothetical protein